MVSRIQAGESQRALCREYGISRWAIQCWLREPFFPKTRGRKPAEAPAEYKYENLLNREFHADRPNRIFLTPTRSKAYYIYFYNHECIQLKNWSGAAHAAPLRLKLHISLYRDLFVLSAQAGAVHDPVGPVQPGFFAPIDNVPVRQI